VLLWPNSFVVVAVAVVVAAVVVVVVVVVDVVVGCRGAGRAGGSIQYILK
jgi:hypothetical protein